MGAIVITLLHGGGSAGRLGAKEKNATVSPNDPTFRLYSLLDSKFNGKLDDFFVLADVFNDPKNPGQAQQHVLRVEYNKDRGFGKLNIYVRTVAQLTPEQLKTYTPSRFTISPRPTVRSSPRPIRDPLAGPGTFILSRLRRGRHGHGYRNT